MDDNDLIWTIAPAAIKIVSFQPEFFFFFLLLVSNIGFASPSSTKDQDPEKDKVLVSVLNYMLTRGHYVEKGHCLFLLMIWINILWTNNY